MTEGNMLQNLGLSEKDMERIGEMCGTKNITVRDLLHQFLCDLIDNDHSAGSDERMNISDWFHRSQF